ncbi:hypothetical protein [Plesiocystis pacifica]|uniref:hypothetical protein n=1 Tax=Plesiocystis pacifica TaxID=191768 RepID=UPI0012FA0DF4|nr:hypothetical protein [Plesiocystis pacifica]
MGLYIRYEFIAVDQPLDRAQLAELGGVSTRAEITPSSFTNHYDWGDLKANPSTLMARYFDAGLRWTSAGDRVLWLRLPYSRATHRRLKPHFVGDGLGLRKCGEHLLVSIWVEDEDWETSIEGWRLGPLLPLRAALLAGDLRPAYIAWLSTVDVGDSEYGDDDDDDAPVPPGLGEFDSALSALVDFLDLDRDLVAAAVEGSPDDTHDSKDLRQWARGLSAKQQQRWLLRALERPELALGREMIAAFRREHPAPDLRPRSVAELRARAHELHALREDEEAERHERARARRAAERLWSAAWVLAAGQREVVKLLALHADKRGLADDRPRGSRAPEPSTSTSRGAARGLSRGRGAGRAWRRPRRLKWSETVKTSQSLTSGASPLARVWMEDPLTGAEEPLEPDPLRAQKARRAPAAMDGSTGPPHLAVLLGIASTRARATHRP